jgi:hypothetical protein
MMHFVTYISKIDTTLYCVFILEIYIHFYHDVKKAAEPIFLPMYGSRGRHVAHLFLPVYIMTIACKSCGRQRDPHFFRRIKHVEGRVTHIITSA